MNISFEYLYRDGANFKNWGGVVLTTESQKSLIELEQEIRDCLIDGMYLVAEEVRLPTLYFKNIDTTVDHAWHEFSELSWSDQPPSLPISIEELISHLKYSFAHARR